MTSDKDFIGILEGYLDEYEGATPLPDAVRDAIRAELPTTKQIGPLRGLMRYPSMSLSLPTPARYGLVAAAILAAAVVGAAYFGRGENVGGPQPTQTATPSPLSFDDHQRGALAPGAYFTTVAGHRITFPVPTGWVKNVVPSVVWTDSSEARVGFATMDNVFIDPCRPDLGEHDPAVGPTVDDLAAALGSLPGVEATTTDATLSGFSWKRVDLNVPSEFGDCVPEGGEALLSSDGPLEPGIHQVWILDVDGTRLVIVAVERPGALDRQAAELQAIVDSIQID
jgi:hypothetical protein